MKKAIIIMLVLSLAVCFSACGGGNDVITYTGDYLEDSSTTTTAPSDTLVDLNNTSSTTAPSTESNTATTVIIPLTTVPGGTVPTVITTANTTEFSTVDYTPLDVSTTKPPVYTTYVNPPQNYIPPQPTQGGNDSTTKKDEVETTRKLTTTTVDLNETDISIDTETNTIIFCISAKKFGKKMKKTSGSNAQIIIEGVPHSASYVVSENLDADENIVVTIEPRGDIAFVFDETVSVVLPKNALVSTTNVTNGKEVRSYGLKIY